MPEVRAIPGNRYEVSCVWCLRPSVPVPATSPENAWADLKRIGWTWKPGAYGGKGGPACKTWQRMQEAPKRRASSVLCLRHELHHTCLTATLLDGRVLPDRPTLRAGSRGQQAPERVLPGSGVAARASARASLAMAKCLARLRPSSEASNVVWNATRPRTPAATFPPMAPVAIPPSACVGVMELIAGCPPFSVTALAVFSGPMSSAMP
jgi:hypothetical protein